MRFSASNIDMADHQNNSQNANGNPGSFAAWSSSFPPRTEGNGYQQFDIDSVEAREYQQELENQQQQNPDNKRPEISVDVTEFQKQEHFSRSEYPQYPPLAKPSGWAIFLRDWWIESIACFFVIASLLAIVGVVWYHNGQPLPNWKHGITINSLVSIFLVIMKSGMGLVLAQGLAHLKWTWFDNARPLQDLETYDKASHGPLGAAMLLWTVKTRHTITTIGAIVTIAALAIDPTVQAMVKYYNCVWPVAGQNATMPQAQVYSEQGLHAYAGTSSVTSGMQSAINSGLFTPGGIVMNVNCPTGNCTLPPTYSSISYCSICTDISHKIKLEKGVGRTYYDDYVDPDTGANYYSYNYTKTSLPSGLSAIYGGQPNDTYFITGSNYDGIIELLVGASPYSGPDSQLAADCNATTKDTWPCRGYGAASCAMVPCVRTFSGTVSGARLIETPLSKYTDWGTAESSSPYNAMVDMSCVADPRKRTQLAQLGYKFDNKTTFIPYHHSFDESTGNWWPDAYAADGMTPIVTNLTLSSLVPRKCIYEINLMAVNTLNQFWNTYFNGTLTPLGTLYSGPSQLETIYNNGQLSFLSVSQTFHNLSMSMTTHIRQNGVEAFSPPTQGQVMKNVTCVRVQWEFLIFPAALICLMLTFFVGMALDTRNRQGVQGIDHEFKSSPLALMVHGLDGQIQEKLQTPLEPSVVRGGEGEKGLGAKKKKGTVKNNAKQVLVRLIPTQHGLRFVQE